MTDTALMYWGEDAPNGTALSPQEIDILRTAFEIAFADGDDENWGAYYDPAVVVGLGRKIEEVYAGSLPKGQVPA